MTVKIAVANDIDAVLIGESFRKGEASDAESLRHYWDSGKGLNEKRRQPQFIEESWVDWLAENKELLGFGERAAYLLMQFARENLQPAANIRAEEADAFRRKLWGHSGGRHDHLLGSYEWYTPHDIVEAARSVMGEIDLDPASCEFANRIVRAKKFYSEDPADELGGGLKKPWRGRLFINPPFAHPTVKHFADKLAGTFEAGEVKQAVWLSNATVDVDWWHRLATMGMVCFHRTRIKFYGRSEELQPPTLGQSIFYLGKRGNKFGELFAKFGVVMRHV
jgi:hypothetical protein